MALNLDTLMETLAEASWILDESADHSGFSDAKLTRMIPIPEGLMDDCVQGLTLYTSAKNMVGPTPAASTTVTDPMVGGKVRSGTWYGGPIRHRWLPNPIDPERQLWLYQDLAKGSETTAWTVIQNGCAYRVSHQWYYKVTALPTVTAGGNGVEYSMADPVKDPDTGFFSTYMEKRERLYQIVPKHTARVSAAGIVEHTTHLGVKAGDVDDTGASIGLPALTPVKGKIVEIARQKERECGQQIDVTESSPSDQVGAEYVESPGRSVAIERHSENAVVPAVPTSETGKIKRRRWVPTPAGNHQTEDEIETPKYQQSSGSVPTRGGVFYWWKGRNATWAQYLAAVAAAALTTDTENTAVWEDTDAGQGNYAITKKPASIVLWTETLKPNQVRWERETGSIYSSAEGRHVQCYRWVKITYDWQTKHLEKDAQSFIDGGLQGSHVEGYGGIGYIAVKVTAIDTTQAYGAVAAGWHPDETFA